MKLITILGPTAVGKTKLAVHIAAHLNGEIISADSRQVYREMDIGTGKDLNDFRLNNQVIPYHLIDIKQAGEKYDVYHFQQDFYSAYKSIEAQKKQAVLCGGTGLYLQAALAKEAMVFVPENKELRNKLQHQDQTTLNEHLKSIHKQLHNKTDLTDRARTIRAIEIATYEQNTPNTAQASPVQEHLVLGLRMNREQLRERIAERLEARFTEGMIEEVQTLLDKGVDRKILDYYGLEYRFVLAFLEGNMDLNTMKEKLLQSIRQFAKRQMTWYRRMEKQGTFIHWLDAEDGLTHNVELGIKLATNAR